MSDILLRLKLVDNAELSQAIKLTYEKRSAEIKIDDKCQAIKTTYEKSSAEIKIDEKVKIVEQDNNNDDDNSENEKYELIANLI